MANDAGVFSKMRSQTDSSDFICYNEVAQGITFFLHLRYGISDVLTGVENLSNLLADVIGILNVRTENPPGITTGKNLISWVGRETGHFFMPSRQSWMAGNFSASFGP